MIKNNCTCLFVYGSLRSGFHHSNYDYISRYFTLIGNAKVKGKLYDLGEYPAAIPTTEEVYITGELYKAENIENFSWAIEQLDAYEGVDTEEGEEQLYRRELTQIKIADDEEQAWIYWYNKGLQGQRQIASGDIMEIVNHKENNK